MGPCFSKKTYIPETPYIRGRSPPSQSPPKPTRYEPYYIAPKSTCSTSSPPALHHYDPPYKAKQKYTKTFGRTL